MKKKIVAGALGIVIVAGVFGVGYFAGQAGGLKTVDTSYSQSTSEKNENASSVIDAKDISQSTATTDVEGTPHSQSTAESMPSVTSVEDTQPRSRISNDINLTYSYDESTGVLSIDWDRLAKNEYIRLDTTMSYFSVMVKYSHIGDSDDFNISVNMHDLCHFIKDYCVNNIEECKNPGAYSIGVRCYKNINDVDDFYLLSFGNVGTPAPLEINWYDSKGKSIDISSTDIEHAMNHLELKLETQGSIKIEDVDIVSVQTNLNRGYLNADLYDKITFNENKTTFDENEAYLMHTSNYWDVYNAEKNEGSPEDTYILSTEDTDGHNEIIELD